MNDSTQPGNRQRSGVVVALQVRPQTGAPPESVTSMQLTPDDGVVGDHSQSSVRQVTILAEEGWHAATSEVGMRVPWEARRANVLVRGIDLPATLKHSLQLGTSQVRVNGETRPCNLMDETVQGLQDALKPDLRGGVYASIVVAGEIKLGDTIQFLETPGA